MKQLIVCVSLLGIALAGFSQNKDITVYHETLDDKSIRIYAKNNTNYQQSVKLMAEYKGMKPSEELPMTQVLAPLETRYFVALAPEKAAYSFGYKYTYIEGDITAIHNDDYVYHLPYGKGKSYAVDQGYNETPTHMDQYALDFHMDEGEEICAVRDGTVVKVVQKNSKGCGKEECSKYNNFIFVRHEDGSVADYSHIQKNGALVKEGDQVKTGQPIARSGSTGWASGPHLHFEIFVMTFSGQKSIKAEYYLNKNTVGIPRSGQKYTQEM